MKKQHIKAAVLSTAISAGALMSSAVSADKIDTIFSVSKSKLAAAKTSQKKIDKLQGSTDDLLQKFKAESKQIEDLRMYNAQLEKQISNQKQKLVDLDEAIANVTVIQRGIPPLAAKMLGGLEEFVALDMPIQKEDREADLAFISEQLTRTDVSVAERFRLVLDAYSKETELGQKVSVHTGDVEINGEVVQANKLSVGRIAYVYQTLDGKRVGAYDKANRTWVPLEAGEYASAIKKAIKIAKKQATQDMIELPISAPEAAQ